MRGVWNFACVLLDLFEVTITTTRTSWETSNAALLKALFVKKLKVPYTSSRYILYFDIFLRVLLFSSTVAEYSILL